MQRDVAQRSRLTALSQQDEAVDAVRVAGARLIAAASPRDATPVTAASLSAQRHVLAGRASAVAAARVQLRVTERASADALASLLETDRQLSALERWDQRRRADAAAAALKAEQREADDLSEARRRARNGSRGVGA